MMRTNLFLLTLLCLAACGRAEDPAVVDIEGVRELLGARHLEDLPGRAALERHPGAALALRELAWHDDALLVRRRAATTLGTLAPVEPQAERFLVELAAAPDPDLRAAALLGLARCDLDGRADLRALVAAHAFAPEVQVAYAAVAALRGHAAARPLLGRVVIAPGVDVRVRSLASTSLGGARAAPPRAVATRVR